MTEVYYIGKARKPKRFTIPPGINRARNLLGLPAPERYTHYTLRTCRRGVEVGIIAPAHWSNGQTTKHWLNLSIITGIWPENFVAARQWVRAWSDRHGMRLEEVKKERFPKASKADNAVFMAGRCREAWLRSDVPKLWAEAVVRCQHPAGYCGQDGFCHYGDCDMEMIPCPAPASTD